MKKTSINVAKRLGVWALVVALILLIPLVGQAPWTLMDFIFSGVVLFGLATSYEVVTQHMIKRTHRIATGIIVLFILMLIWAWAVA